MPAPPSFIDIVPAFPFIRTVTQAEFNGGTFGGVANEVWFRFVTATDIVLGMYANKGGTFKPNWSVRQSDGTTVIKAVSFSFNISFYVILSPGTYYIQITRNGGGVSNFDFTSQFDIRPLEPNFVIPIPALVINDDAQPFPAAILNLNGTVVGFTRQIPAGEIGGILPSGTSLWHDRFGMKGAVDTFALVDKTLTYISSVNTGEGHAQFPRITNSNTNFYIVDGNDGTIQRISALGISSGIIATLPVANPSTIGVTADGSIMYWADGYRTAGGPDPVIHRYNLLTDTPLSDFYTIPASSLHQCKIAITPNNFPGDLIVLTDGSVVTWYYDVTLDNYNIIHISSLGVLLHMYTYEVTDPYYYIDHLARPNTLSDSIYIWRLDTNFIASGKFGTLDLSTGIISPIFNKSLFSEGENLVQDDSTLHSASESCTMVILLGNGTIQVIKNTVPSGSTQAFNFVAGGGLTPSSFTLLDTDEQDFNDLTPGDGYSIVEDSVSDFGISYNVSNGSPNTDITVAAGETVVVTVTNTLTANTKSGIYKIEPGKRNDTLWLEGFEGTEDVKIPDPSYRTSFIGD